MSATAVFWATLVLLLFAALVAVAIHAAGNILTILIHAVWAWRHRDALDQIRWWYE